MFDFLLPLSVVFVSLILGGFIFLQNRGNRVNLTFSFVAVMLGLCTLAVFLGGIARDNTLALFWLKTAYVFGAFLPSAFLYFAYIFPREKTKTPSLFYLLAVLPVIIFVCLIPFNVVIKEVLPVSWGNAISTGPLYSFYSAYFLLYLGWAFFLLLRKYQEAIEGERNKIRYLFLGTFLTSALAIFFNVVLPLLGNSRLWMLGPYSTVFLVGFTTYAITKHRLMDISVVVSRAVAELLTILFYGTIYVLLAWLHHSYVATVFDWRFLVWTIPYGIMVGQFYQRTRLFFQTTSDKLILHGKYDYYKELSEASMKVSRTLALPEILKVLFETFYNVVEIHDPKIFLPESFADPHQSSRYYVAYKKDGSTSLEPAERIDIGDQLLYDLLAKRCPILNDRSVDRQLIVPCILEDRLIGIFVLGKKLSQDPYTDEDIQLLEVLASQVAVALDHTRSYEKIRVDLESAERQLERSQRLASIGTLTAGVTHEIRNPLTVIKTETERLLAQPRDQAYLKQYQELMLRHIERITGIIHRMLNLAKDKPKQEIDINLNEMIEAALELVQLKKIVLQKDFQPIPPVKGDAEGLQEVFVNLIQNAINAMPDGGSLTLKTYGEEGRVIAEVIDTGMGIPDEIKEKIFDPFFSTRHEGVGLGLSIAYRIVRSHGGDIKVVSQVGQGTTFRLIF